MVILGACQRENSHFFRCASGVWSLLLVLLTTKSKYFWFDMFARLILSWTWLTIKSKCPGSGNPHYFRLSSMSNLSILDLTYLSTPCYRGLSEMPSPSALALIFLSNSCYCRLDGMPSLSGVARRMVISLGFLKENMHSHGRARGLAYHQA